MHHADNLQGEIFKETKERLSKRTGIKGKPFEKIKFAVVGRNTTFATPKYLEDGKLLNPRNNYPFSLLTIT